MKKFSKILALLVAIVAIVTTFTVVSLATSEETPQPFEAFAFDFV